MLDVDPEVLHPLVGVLRGRFSGGRWRTFRKMRRAEGSLLEKINNKMPRGLRYCAPIRDIVICGVTGSSPALRNHHPDTVPASDLRAKPTVPQIRGGVMALRLLDPTQAPWRLVGLCNTITTVGFMERVVEQNRIRVERTTSRS